ncbi:MAG TPA: MlaD family protein [Vicinamibacterales bacterium]|jgi:phospholipid/cholesterol/gamma-HCH transport system substrate-binding protein|nr:MlaD family protein [Vicinamibacterales bacterium]
MPRTRSLGWAELKIGIVTAFAIIMAMTLIFLLSGEGGFFWERYSVKTLFPNAAGLKPGAPVRLAGVEVGSVAEVDLAGNQVEVVMEINRNYQPQVTTASRASLGSVSLLGESAVDITASSSGTPVPEWGYVDSGPAAGSLTEVTTKAAEGIEQLTVILQEIRGGRGTIGRLITDDALYREMNTLVAAAEDVVQNVNGGRGTLGRLVNDPTAARALETSLQNFETISARIRAGEGTLGKFLTDDTVARSVTSTTSNLNEITGRINRGEGTAGRLINDRALYDRLNSMSDRLDKVMAGLQQGEGTAGRLLRDRELYENMNSAVGELRQLVRDIRADPRKFLNVRVSIF